MSAADPELPRYRILAGPEGDRAVPASGVGVGLRNAAAAALGRTGLFAGHLRRAFRRLRSDPTARSVRFAFAEAHLGRGLQAHVDPAGLDRYLPDVVTDGRRAVRLAHWFLDGCDWSEAILPLAGSEVDGEVAALFDHDGRLHQSPAFQSLVARMAEGRPDRRNGVPLDSLARIEAYFDHYRRLRDSIAAHGLASREAVPAAAREGALSTVRGPGAERRERDIGLAVGRSGRFIRLVGGRHRTAIAQRLKLPRIPVQIRLVHVDWLAGQIEATSLRPDLALVDGIRRLGSADAA